MNILKYNVCSENFESFENKHEGATLRASEVKPKLDRYLFNILGEQDYNKGVEKARQEQWLIKNAPHPALNYKMKIIRDASSNKQTIHASLIITVKDDGLKDLITNNIPMFIKDARFGKGQKNKGKGYFMITNPRTQQ